jgi:ElaB/YqjD/DUF883 family membrane-anchored ribosome-binding protein
MATSENEALNALKADMSRLRDDLSAVTDTLKNIAGAEGSAAFERVRKTAEDIRGEGNRLARSAVNQVEEKPLTAMIAAFVVGLLMGLLFSRRS